MGKQYDVKYDHEGCTVYAHLHSWEDTERAWHITTGQGNAKALLRDHKCVVVACNKVQALLLSAMFHNLFAIETCCNYDGDTLSMYCGDTGGGWKNLKHKLEGIVISMGLGRHIKNLGGKES